MSAYPATTFQVASDIRCTSVTAYTGTFTVLNVASLGNITIPAGGALTINGNFVTPPNFVVLVASTVTTFNALTITGPVLIFNATGPSPGYEGSPSIINGMVSSTGTNTVGQIVTILNHTGLAAPTSPTTDITLSFPSHSGSAAAANQIRNTNPSQALTVNGGGSLTFMYGPDDTAGGANRWLYLGY